MRKSKILIGIVLCLFLILCYSAVKAENLEDLQNKRNELQTNLNNANEEIEAIEIELTETLQKIAELEGQILEYDNSLNQIKAELSTIEGEINQTEDKLTILQNSYETQKKTFEKRLVAMYEAGETTYLDVLLNSRSIQDFISNYYLIGEIAAIDNELLETIEKEKNQIEEIKVSLDTKREILKQKEETEERTLITLNNTKLQRDNYVLNLTAQETEIRENIKEYETQLDSVELQIDSIMNGITGSGYSGGLFAWPTPGYKTITSPFGTRLHPVLKVYRKHTGIDIGAPKGAYVIATNSGTVVESRWMGSYGNAVIINHGGGFATLYAHGSELLVNAGKEVQRGDVIMKVGSTGMSTGPHLHFEIRINGKTVNPTEYLAFK